MGVIMDLFSFKNKKLLPMLVLSFTSAATGTASASNCSNSDWNQINAVTTELYQALMYGQLNRVAQLEQQLAATLSPPCQQELRTMSQGVYSGYSNYGGYGNYGSYNNYGGYDGYQGGNVYDHGGGAYSTSGVYCGPSGCY